MKKEIEEATIEEIVSALYQHEITKQQALEWYRSRSLGDIARLLFNEQQSHQKLKDAAESLLEWHDSHYDISFIDADIIEAFKQALTNEP